MGIMKKIGCLFLLLGAMGTGARAQIGTPSDLVINEIQVCNIDQFIDPSYNYGGWVELYNPTSSIININQLYVSNDEQNLKLWQLPTDMGTIQPGGFVTLWFDHYDTGNIYSDAAYKQIGFKLNYEGDTLFLSDSKGKLIASQPYPAAIQRTSYARITDGGETWGITATPTPGSSNVGCNFATEQLEAPIVDRDAMMFTSQFHVHVKIPDGATLRYTTDGSTPSMENGSTSTTGRFLVKDSTQIYRFRLFQEGFLPSAVVTRTYIYKDKDYYLPIISVVTDNRNLFDNTIGVYTVGTNGITGYGLSTNSNKNRSWERPVNFEYLVPEKNTDGGSFLMALNQECDFEVCGGWSRNQYAPNASFRLKGGKYYLGQNFFPYAVFEDKPYIKNKVLQVRNGGNNGYSRIWDAAIHQILIESGLYIDCQAVQPAHVFINGKFQFTYNIREPSNKNHGYSNYGIDTDEMDQFEITAGKGYVQKVGTNEAFVQWMTLAQKLANNPKDTTLYEQICELVDIDEYCNYMAAECYIGSSDWLTNNNNVKGYRSQDNGKFHLVVLDADSGFGVSDMMSRLASHLYNSSSSYSLTGRNYLIDIFLNMLKYEPFRKRFVDTFCLMDGSVFTQKRCTTIIESMRSRMEKAMSFEPRNDLNSSANSLISQITNKRTERMNNFMEYMKENFKMSSTMGATISANVPSAKLSVNNLEIPTGSFSGQFFNPVILRAEPLAGYAFTGWKLNDNKRTSIFGTSASWKFYDKGSLDDENWKDEDYSATGWQTGFAPLGYGNVGINGSSDYNTILNYGSDANNKRPTYYFRRSFSISAEPAEKDYYQLRCYVDDGCVVYVNGQEVGRYLMPEGATTYNQYSTTYVAATAAVVDFYIDNALIHKGVNTVAVEVHNTSATSSDIYWTAALYRGTNNTRIVSTDEELNISKLKLTNPTLTALYTPLNDTLQMANKATPIKVNEVSCANSIFVNDYFKKNDWIELYNTTDTNLDAAGLYVSDNITSPYKYQIPSNADFKTIIPAHGHLVIWADKLEPLNQLHANFKLDNDEEQTVLINSSDEFVANNQAFFETHPMLSEFTDELTYTIQRGDQSVGRYPDGGNRFYLMSHPTIERPNALLSVDELIGEDEIETAVIPIYEETASSATPVGYYTLSGMFVGSRSENLRPGIYIVRLNNGQCRKVVIR